MKRIPAELLEPLLRPTYGLHEKTPTPTSTAPKAERLRPEKYTVYLYSYDFTTLSIQRHNDGTCRGQDPKVLLCAGVAERRRFSARSLAWVY